MALVKKVAIASDHGGFQLKQEIMRYLKKRGLEYEDRGCFSEDAVDYPDYAQLVAEQVSKGLADRGILVCGTGIGMAIAANKVKGVRAASISDLYSAAMTRRHNDLNVLCLGGRILAPGFAEEIVKTFLDTKFEGGRHGRRLEKIHEVECD